MTGRKHWQLLLFLACVLAACATTRISMAPGPRAFTPRDYANVYEAWTRDADEFAFGRLVDVLNVTATFESWEFRWAYVVRYARDYSLDTQARSEMLRGTLADAQEHHRFFVTLAGRNFRESDLTSDRSAWRVLLVDESGRATTPTEVKKIRTGAAERTYFPSVSPFRQAFRIEFPARYADGRPVISPRSKHFVLRFTGPEGTADLRWSFTR